jgi:hypothetical protein
MVPPNTLPWGRSAKRRPSTPHSEIAENPNYETPDVQAGLEIAAACARQKCVWPSLARDNMLPATLIALDLPMESTGASVR